MFPLDNVGHRGAPSRSDGCFQKLERNPLGLTGAAVLPPRAPHVSVPFLRLKPEITREGPSPSKHSPCHWGTGAA